MRIWCSHGLGNRVAAMANGLSWYGGIDFMWQTNAHCPVAWWEVFPNGIGGVRFIEARDKGSHFTTLGWKSCERWDAAADRGRADAAYGVIMALMAGLRRPGCRVSIAGRFYRNPGADVRELARAAAEHAGGDPVFVFADSRRVEIRTALDDLGVDCFMPVSDELGSDLGRDRAGTLAYLGDWQRLMRSQTIVAADGPSSALHPARAAGKQIIYVAASQPQHRCEVDATRASKSSLFQSVRGLF